MTDLRKEFSVIKIGLVFIWISFLINPIYHGVNIGLLLCAAGCLIIALKSKSLITIDKKFKKVLALSIFVFIFILISNVILFKVNADPSEMLEANSESITFPVQAYYVQYGYTALFTIAYASIALMMIVLLSIIAKICKVSGAYRYEEILTFRKKFIKTSIIYLILVFASQLLFVTYMNSYNLVTAGSITDEELIVMQAPYAFVSLLYLVFDIIFFIRIIKVERYAKLMSECALFDSNLYDKEEAINASFVEKEDSSSYDNYN